MILRPTFRFAREVVTAVTGGVRHEADSFDKFTLAVSGATGKAVLLKATDVTPAVVAAKKAPVQ